MSEKKEKSPYFSMDEDIEAIKLPYDAKEFATSGLKILGKGLLNAGIFAVKEVAPRIPEAVGNAVRHQISRFEKQIAMLEKQLEDESLSTAERRELKSKIEAMKSKIAEIKAKGR